MTIGEMTVPEAEEFIRKALSHFEEKGPTERTIKKAAHKASKSLAFSLKDDDAEEAAVAA
jgi:hypothetical protein